MKKLSAIFLAAIMLFSTTIHSFAEVNKEIYLTKRSQVSNDSAAIADRILGGELYVSPTYSFYKTTKKITWKEDPFHSTTWRLYYQSLDTLSFLTNAYEKTNDTKYLLYGLNLIKSFWSVNSNPAKPSDYYTYNAHTIANRTNNLMYFYHYYANSSVATQTNEDYIKNILRLHGSLLNSSKYYDTKTNYGYFQDRALIQFAAYFPEEATSSTWRVNALNRTKAHIKKDFTVDGLHKEHSPQYFDVVMTLIGDINKIANDRDLTNLLLKAQNAFAKLVLSDFSVPRLGDTDFRYLPKPSQYSVLDPEFEYVITKGKSGVQPPLVSNISNAVAVVRDGWGVNTSSLLFTASNFSTSHKHADDLSFIYSQNGKEIFTDGGKYNYNTSDPYQKYLRTTFAHNVVTIDGKSYPISVSNVGKSKMTNFIDSPESVIITGEHTIYSGVRVYRTMVYLKENKVTLIQDEILSNTSHKTEQIFNIGQGIENSKIDPSSFLLNQSIMFKQHTPSSVKEYFGQKTPIRGFASTVFNSIYPIKQLDFQSSGKNVQYFTSISNNANSVMNFSLNEDTYKIDMSDGTSFNVIKPLGTPYVYNVSDQDKVLKGFTQGGALISVMDGTKQIASGQADLTGNFTISLPLQKAGKKLNIVVTSKNKQYKNSAVTVVLDKTPPNTPTVKTASSKTKIISGTTEKSISILAKNGSTTYTTTSDKYGNYQLKILALKKGITISVSAKDNAGNISKAKLVKVS
ncbi:hypothetical protein CN692_11765 [Bacillus sp. AFS002410]|uniref:heparinase II/III family protein n=1 Tax=Bacillus sp. AFS002410 TaxID=2033481 RepID=UPI000BEFA9DC|nr:heparinase II/III family protein [Bacillus sp. AFS002410]PEJ57758.1 hypothetical protein CN692_11765 [Bacillus sp. AFS002410]